MTTGSQTVTTGRTIKDLATLLRAVAAAGEDPDKLEELLDVVTALDGMFEGAVLFKGGYGGGSFVIASSRGLSGEAARSWLRWPLRRLFARMKPARILDPAHGDRAALAIPFSHGNDHRVIVAPLAEPASALGTDDFLASVESVTVPRDSAASPLMPVALSLAPTVMSFATCADLCDRLSSALARRGWPVEAVSTFGKLTRRMQEFLPDIVVVDAAELGDPVSAITSIHRIADYGALCVLAFYQEEPHALFPAIVDRWLPHDASETTIFKTIKQLAQEASALRHASLHEERVMAQRRALSAPNANELARLAAQRAAEAVGGWAACSLISESGTVYRAEHPNAAQPVLASIPKGFLSGTRSFYAVFDDEFLDELTDAPNDRSAFLSLRPVSAASVALVSQDGYHRGVLVACSFDRAADTQAFEVLANLADVVVDRFEELRAGVKPIPELQKERFWERLRDRMIDLDVYHSADCAIPWRYRQVTETRGLLTLNVEEDGDAVSSLMESSFRMPLADAFGGRDASAPFFVATIDSASQAMDYATLGFSAPMLFDRRGPVATIARTRGVTTGMARLDPSANTVVCDEALFAWLSQRLGSADSLPVLLDREKPAGFASIITLG